MTEERPNPDQPPSPRRPNGDQGAPEWPAPESPAEPAADVPPAEAPPADVPPADAPPADAPPAEPLPPDPPAADIPPPPPAPWASPPPAPPADLDDEALREQRARRFGSPDPAGEPGPTPPHEAPAPPPEVATQAGPEPEQEGAWGPAPVVTPLPAAPPQPTGEHAFPPTTQLPAEPAAQPGHYEEFEDFQEEPTSRAAAHWWTVLITLVFAPVGWYLVADGGARIAWAISRAETPAVTSYIEIGLGLVAVFVFLLAARWSSLGALIWGSLIFAMGVAFLIFPAEGSALLADAAGAFSRLGQFGINVADHLRETLATGRMALYGLVMIMVGVVSHGARRQGRREERANIALGE